MEKRVRPREAPEIAHTAYVYALVCKMGVRCVTVALK